MRASELVVEQLSLGELCRIGTNQTDSDFWIVRRGTAKNLGRPQREFAPEHIGIKVLATDKINPDYLYYMMLYVYNQGYWQNRSHGTLALQHIRVKDVKDIVLQTA